MYLIIAYLFTLVSSTSSDEHSPAVLSKSLPLNLERPYGPGVGSGMGFCLDCIFSDLPPLPDFFLHLVEVLPLAVAYGFRGLLDVFLLASRAIMIPTII